MRNGFYNEDQENINQNQGQEYGENLNHNKINNKRPKSTKKQIVVLVLVLLCFLFVAFEVYNMVLYTLGKKEKSEMKLYNTMNTIVGTFITKKPSITTEEFSLKLAGLGDIYGTEKTIKGAKTATGYDFSKGIDSVLTKLKDYDVVLASLNTVVGSSSLGYSKSDYYNTPVDILDTIKKLNVDVLATASNHSMDKKEAGVLATLSNLAEKEIVQTGMGQEKRAEPIVITKNNITLGILSYTLSTDTKMSKGKEYLVNVFDEENLKQDMEYLKSKNVDYVISYLCMVNVDSTMPNAKQKNTVDTLFNAGVNVVFGTGCKVVQEDMEDEIKMGEEKSHVYTIYSLGDFIGQYETDEQKANVIASLEFTKKITKNKKGEIINTQTDMKTLAPIYIWNSVTAKYENTKYLIKDEVEAYNNNKSVLTTKEFNALRSAYARFTELFD